MAEDKKPEPSVVQYDAQDEIDLLEMARTIWRGRKLILCIVIICTLATIILSLTMTNIYTAKAVIKPVMPDRATSRFSSLASQYGGLAGMVGIAMPNPSSSVEIANLLKSNVLKKEMIERYQLLPILFPKRWDPDNKTWKKPGVSLNPLALLAKLRPADPKAPQKEPGKPDTWDGIRALNNIVKISHNIKEDVITIAADFDDAETAAQIVDYYIVTLNEHMSSEARRIATINKEYLEKQLLETNDALVQQKIYSLIAEKIETMMMAEVNEGFAFKVLDPPMTPDRKSKPKRAQMVVLAFTVSLFIGVFVVLFREYLRKIKDQSAGGPNAS